MISPNLDVAISEAEEQVAEPRGAEGRVVQRANGGVWSALRRRADALFSRWVEQQYVLTLYGGDPEDP